MANAKKIIRIVGIVLLVIGSIGIVVFASGMYIVGSGWGVVFIFPTIWGVVIFVIGLVLLILSMKISSSNTLNENLIPP